MNFNFRMEPERKMTIKKGWQSVVEWQPKHSLEGWLQFWTNYCGLKCLTKFPVAKQLCIYFVQLCPNTIIRMKQYESLKSSQILLLHLLLNTYKKQCIDPIFTSILNRCCIEYSLYKMCKKNCLLLNKQCLDWK